MPKMWVVLDLTPYQVPHSGLILTLDELCVLTFLILLYLQAYIETSYSATYTDTEVQKRSEHFATIFFLEEGVGGA